MDLKSVKWRSRRGMLELDLILQPFLETRFEKLDSIHQKLYWTLLEEEDQDLWRWFLGIEQAPESYQKLISIINAK